MTLQELEAAVTKLPTVELEAFTKWFEEFLADAWDRQLEADIEAGKLDAVGNQAQAQFESGHCKPL